MSLSLWRELDNDFDDFFGGHHRHRPLRIFDYGPSASNSLSKVGSNAQLGLHETPDGYDITVDVPGVSKENVTVSVDNEKNLVEVIAHQKDENSSDKDGEKRSSRSERYYQRNFTLPLDAKKDSLQAKLDHGVLQLSLKKVKPEEIAKDKKKLIAIN
jgi:HSP20 family protein